MNVVILGWLLNVVLTESVAGGFVGLCIIFLVIYNVYMILVYTIFQISVAKNVLVEVLFFVILVLPLFFL